MPRIAAALAVFLTVVTCIGFNTARYPVVWEMVAASNGSSQSHESDQSVVSPQSAAASQSATVAGPQTTEEWGSGWDSNREPAETMPRESTQAEPICALAAGRREDSPPGWAEGAPIEDADYGPGDFTASPEPPADANPEREPAEPQSDVGPPSPVEVPASAKYASSAFDTSAPLPNSSASSVDDAEDTSDAARTDEPDVPSTLVPVEPRDKGHDASGTCDAGSTEGPLTVAQAGNSNGVSKLRRLPSVDQVSTIPEADNQDSLPDDPIPIYPTTGIE